VEGNQARISLLRSPTEPARNTDEGRHAIRYAIVPHDSRVLQHIAMHEGYAFNHPLVVTTALIHPGDMPSVKSFFRVFPPQVIVEAIKQSFNSQSTIVRLFNASMDAVDARIEGPLVDGATPVELDMLERPVKEVAPAPAGGATFKCLPAEIKTIELRGGDTTP
jgi:alpha-mannosidase